VIADCAEFRIRRVVLGAGERLHLRAGEQPRLISVVSGSVKTAEEPQNGTRTSAGRSRLTRGDNALVPFAGAFTFAADVPAILLVTENFTGRPAA
jgi:mannose-6-phosphate isomerase